MSMRRADSYPTAYHGRAITPEIFVWHSTDGGGKWWLDQLFSGLTTNGGSKVTVHFAIYKDGDLVQYAPWKRGEAVACWHAGKSMWQGRESCNFFSLGCEIQHAPGEDFTPAQLEAMRELTRAVREEYPDMVHTTHKHISGALQGKTDPFSPQWEEQAWPVIWETLMEADLMGAAEIEKKLDAMRADIDASQRADSFRGNIALCLAIDDEAGARGAVAEALKEGAVLPASIVEKYGRPQ